MRILHLAWEYPPVMYGGLGRHVHALANAQAALGHQVVVITQSPSSGEPGTDSGPVQVVRAGDDPARPAVPRDDLLDWVGAMEDSFIRAGTDLLRSWRPDVIHAHDWMVSRTAVELRESSGCPLVVTIHATEAGRNNGWLTSELSTAIHAREWWLANTSDALITCSHTMRAEVSHLFGVAADRVVPNGIDLADWTASAGAIGRILRLYPSGDPLVVYTGRLEWEKGVQTLLEAVPALQRTSPGLQVLVAGRGSYAGELHDLARRLGLGDRVLFLGWVSEADLRAIVATADIAVVPSLYEPFGLVALEAAAMGTPLIVARTGGLAEFADDGGLAATFTPGDPASLVDAIRHACADSQAGEARARLARRALGDRYSWRDVALRTEAAYEDGRRWMATQDGEPARVERRLDTLPSLAIPRGNVFTGEVR